MVALDPLFRYSTVAQSNSHQKKKIAINIWFHFFAFSSSFYILYIKC